MKDSIQIVIGSWGSYNECNERALGSSWLTLSDYDSWDEIEKGLVTQGFELDGIDEELFVQDVVGFPSVTLNWDVIHPESFFELLKQSGVLNSESKLERMNIYCEFEFFSEWERLVKEHGENWDNNMILSPEYDWYDLGYYFLHEFGDIAIPPQIEDYIDYARYGESYAYDGFYKYDNGIVEIRR